MSKVKNSLPERIWDLTEKEQNKYLFKEYIRILIERGNPYTNPELREFLERVTPMTGPDYFIYVKDEDDGTIANIKFNRDDYINALCVLTEEKVTLFYHLAAFNGWIEDVDATSVRCICIDIDDVGINADEADFDVAINFLRNELKLKDEEFCDYINFSGHGIHAIWLIDEISAKDEEIRRRYLESLLVKMEADCSCSPISHQFRTPCSFNLKDKVIKSKLYKITDCSNTDIHRLDWCLLPTEITDEYRKNYYARVHEKSLQTARKNKELVKKLEAELGDTPIEQYLSRTDLSEEERYIGERLRTAQSRRKQCSRNISTDNQDDLDLYLYHEKSLPFEHLKPYTNFKPENRTWNLIYDIQNLFIRRHGYLPSRNMFFTVLAHIFKYKKESVRNAIKFCMRFVDKEYKDEMVEIIETVFSNDKIYTPNHEKIARLFCMSERDINESYCNFSKERKDAARKVRNHNHYENNRIKAGKLSPAERREMHIAFLKAHPDIKDKEAMEILGIGRSTFYTLKKAAENNGSPKN